MNGFRVWLAEISSMGGLEAPPSLQVQQFTRKSIAQSENEPNQRIIPLVIHSDVAQTFRTSARLDHWREGVPYRFKAAMDVFDRLEDQIEKGGPPPQHPDMLVTYASNSEAQSIRELGEKMVKESDLQQHNFSSEIMKNAIVQWKRQGNLLIKAVESGIKFATINRSS